MTGQDVAVSRCEADWVLTRRGLKRQPCGQPAVARVALLSDGEWFLVCAEHVAAYRESRAWIVEPLRPAVAKGEDECVKR